LFVGGRATSLSGGVPPAAPVLVTEFRSLVSAKIIANLKELFLKGKAQYG
jgi:hypothetical protein